MVIFERQNTGELHLKNKALIYGYRMWWKLKYFSTEYAMILSLATKAWKNILQNKFKRVFEHANLVIELYVTEVWST